GANQKALVGDGAPTADSRTAVVFLVGDLNLNRGDRAAKQRLEKKDLVVEVRKPDPQLWADVHSAALIVVSSTIDSRDVGTQLRDVPVPLVTWEEALFGDLGMTGPWNPTGATESGNRAYDEVVIKDPAHPLAARLSGVARVTTALTLLDWG